MASSIGKGVTLARLVPPDTRKGATVARSEQLALLLGEAERRVRRRLAHVLADHDCTVERWRTLALLDGGRSHRMSELAEVAQLPPASLTRLIDGMVADNLVYRKADAGDRRRVLVHVAPRGSALYRRLSERIAAENGAIIGDVDGDEVAHLVESLAGFVARLR
jgi:DNA-binding MarR family transcriptional regulator